MRGWASPLGIGLSALLTAVLIAADVVSRVRKPRAI